MIKATETKTVTERFVLMPVNLFYHGEQFYVRVPEHLSESAAEQFAQAASYAVKINFLDDPRNVTLSGGVL